MTPATAVLRVMTVDDEPDMLQLMRTLLTFDGECEVVAEAADSEQAYAAWHQTRPDVIVLDMRMPGGSGLELARRILAADPGQPVVLCSAYLDPDELEAARLAGVAACLEKTDVGRLAQVALSVSRRD
ncbi:MAG: hypothetical protein NVS3B26_16070 [Mycobacteriales bacterium]